MKSLKHFFRRIQLFPKVTPDQTGEGITSLFRDGLAELYFDRDEECAVGLHQLILSYPGGWQAIRFTREDWAEMKDKVDGIFKKLSEERGYEYRD